MISHKVHVLATLAVLFGRARADETTHGPQALGMATQTQVGTTNNADNLAFTPVVQRGLPVGPDYRGAINFATGTTPWWPLASWIGTPRSEETERQVNQWLDLHTIDASGDEQCGLLGHGMVTTVMQAAFVDVIPAMIVTATQGLNAESHESSAVGQLAPFPQVLAFRTRGGSLGVLEIRGFTDDRKLVKFRYKLVRSDEQGKTAAPPPPAALLTEIQRETIDETIHNLLFKTPTLSSAVQPLGRPIAAYFDQVAQEPRVAKLSQVIRDGTPAQQQAIRESILRKCQVYVDQLPDCVQPNATWGPTVTNPGGGAAYPLLLCHCDPEAESLPILVSMCDRFQQAARNQQKELNPTWLDSQSGILSAYACQLFLDRVAADPQSQSRLKPEQASVLRVYQQYREATKLLGAFLYQSEMMRFASDFVAAGKTPVPRRVEKIDKTAFEVLTIDVTGFWPGQQTIVIYGDGAYTFDEKDYHAVYQLGPEHLGQLVELLKATDWLTMATGHAMVDDATNYTLTLDREGRRTKVASDGTQQNPYKELIRLIRRIGRQETLLHQTTNPTQQDSAAHDLRGELAALKGQPTAMPYAPILDHNRLVPVFAEWLAKPQGRSEDVLAAAAEWVAHLEIESQRPNLEAIARGRMPDEPECKVPSAARIAAVTALGQLGGGRSLSLLESLEADNDSFVRDAVADAVLSAPPNEAIPILQEMAADSRAAAWALIRLGGQAESAIIEILAEPIFRSSGPENLIREYYEHWKELPAPPNAAIVKAIRDRVQADAKDGPPDRYGVEVLKLSGDSLEEVQR